MGNKSVKPINPGKSDNPSKSGKTKPGTVGTPLWIPSPEPNPINTKLQPSPGRVTETPSRPLPGPPTESRTPNLDRQPPSGDGNQENNTNTQSSPDRIVIALYTFNGRNEGDLSFKKGEKLIVVESNNPDWWYAKRPGSEDIGYIPALYVVSKTIETEE